MVGSWFATEFYSSTMLFYYNDIGGIVT